MSRPVLIVCGLLTLCLVGYAIYSLQPASPSPSANATQAPPSTGAAADPKTSDHRADPEPGPAERARPGEAPRAQAQGSIPRRAADHERGGAQREDPRRDEPRPDPTKVTETFDDALRELGKMSDLRAPRAAELLFEAQTALERLEEIIPAGDVEARAGLEKRQSALAAQLQNMSLRSAPPR